MKIYTYDKNTFEYLYEDEAQLDPLETQLQGKEIYLIPASSTTIAPKICEENTTNIFDEKKQEWNIVKDFRGTAVYNKKTAEEFLITELGDIPTGYVLEKPFNAQIAKIEAIKEINNIFNIAFSTPIKVKGIEVNIDKRNELLNVYNSLDEEHNKYFFNTEEVAIELTKEDLKEITDALYERSIELPTLKNEFIKKIKLRKGASSIQKIVEEVREKLA